MPMASPTTETMGLPCSAVVLLALSYPFFVSPSANVAALFSLAQLQHEQRRLNILAVLVLSRDPAARHGWDLPS